MGSRCVISNRPAAAILFRYFLRSDLLSKLKMVTNSAATSQERLLITHLRYFELFYFCFEMLKNGNDTFVSEFCCET